MQKICFNIPLPWNIQANRQYTYCDVTNAFITIFLFSRAMQGATFLCVEFLTCLTFEFLQMWSSKEKFEWRTVLNSSFLFSVLLVLLSIYALTLSLFVVDLLRALLRILSYISDGVFCENDQRLSVGNHFCKKASS